MKRKIILIAAAAVTIMFGLGLANFPSDPLARVSANIGTSESAQPDPVEPQSQCDSCKPRVAAPTVRYVRYNGAQHEVEVSFTYSLPGCFGTQPTPDFRIVTVHLNFQNGIRRERVNAGVAEVGTCTGVAGTCRTIVRVAGAAQDGRAISYFASVEASIPIKGFGISANNAPF
jgi:hypothetical protein